MTTTSIGRDAEERAARFLENKGFTIVAKNWRTRWCEIDIIARKCNRNGLKKSCRAHLVEVKFRRSSRFGDPEEYVTSTKKRQLTKAAEHWVHETDWSGSYQIDVLAVDGASDQINYIPNITG